MWYVVCGMTLAPQVCRDGEHVGFSPIRQALRVPIAKRRQVLGKSHEG